MHFSQPPALLSLLFAIFSSIYPSVARPSLSDELKQLLESRYHYLSERSCNSPCGYIASGPLCCTTGQTCSNGVCVGSESGSGSGSGSAANVNNGQWQYYTTTYTETDLVVRTSTYSSNFGVAAATPAAPSAASINGISCNSALGESPCATICCATGQYCAYAGQCQASNGNGGSSSSIFGAATVAPSNTPAVRPTSNAITTVTSTGSATTTVPFQTGAAATTAAAGMSTTSNNGLSGGAIAGIVIGVLAAIFLLLLICTCFCLKGLADGCLTFFGLKRRKTRREETYIEEHHSHHGGGGNGGAVAQRRWFGVGPSRISRPQERKSGVGGLTYVVGGLGALAMFLGLKRRRNEKKRQKSEYGSASSYSYEYSTSGSESRSHRSWMVQDANRSTGSASSDDRYTRRSHRSGPSRR